MRARRPADAVEAVLDAVARIPAGRVLSYGDVAELAGLRSARLVGQVLARYGGSPLPWHRVVMADGRCAPGKEARQLALLVAEGAPHRGERVDMARARWDGKPVPTTRILS